MERSSGAAPPRPFGQRGGNAEQAPEPISIDLERRGDGLSIIALGGELDLSTVPRVEERLIAETRRGAGVVVDLRRLSFIDSSGISLLIKAHKAATSDMTLQTVVRPGSQVERVFDLAGVYRAVPRHVDRDQAVAAVKASAEQPPRPG